METTNPKNLGAVAVTQLTPTNHTSNSNKISWNYTTLLVRTKSWISSLSQEHITIENIASLAPPHHG